MSKDLERSKAIFVNLFSQVINHVTNGSLACVAADSFPFSDGAKIEQANEKRASEGARLG